MEQPSNSQLDKGWKQLRDEETEPFHFQRSMANLQDKIERRNRVMFAFKNVAIGSSILTVVILALLLIPASYSVDLGTIAKAEFMIDDEADMKSVIEATQSIGGVVNRSLNVRNDKAELSLAVQDKSADEVEHELQAALAPFSGGGLSITSEIIKQHMGGNALAAVTGGRVRIACDELSEDQIREQIIAELTARGANVRDVDVSVSKEQDGDQIRVEVRVEAEADADGNLPDLDDLPEHLLPDIGDGQEERIIIRREVREE